MGNYATCKKYTQKEKNHFILLTKSHFSLIAKNCVAIGTGSLIGEPPLWDYHPLLEILDPPLLIGKVRSAVELEFV